MKHSLQNFVKNYNEMVNNAYTTQLESALTLL